MNPAIMLTAVLLLSNNRGPFKRMPLPFSGNLKFPGLGPAYIDTFKMELVLDKLHTVTNSLEKVNHLNQMRNVPLTKDNSIHRIQESVDAVRTLLADHKGGKQLDTISSTLSGVKKIGDMEGMMSSLGPILSMLSNQSDS